MSSTAWSSLPNAQLIDWVIESVKNNPQLWYRARDAAWNAAWYATWIVAWDAAWDTARAANLLATLDAAADAATGDGATAAPADAQCALAALVVYDDCSDYLAMTYDELRAWALLSETPQAVLLLPMKWVQEHEHKCLVTPA